MQAFPQKRFYACDLAPTAVELLKVRTQLLVGYCPHSVAQKSPNYQAQRCEAFVADVTASACALTPPIPPACIDVAVMIFVLSAVDPAKMSDALRSIFHVLKPGGLLLFRDYGLYDMVQLRFISKRDRKLSPTQFWYQRADGTRTYFFTVGTKLDAFEELLF